jgi:hypothetical protein
MQTMSLLGVKVAQLLLRTARCCVKHIIERKETDSKTLLRNKKAGNIWWIEKNNVLLRRQLKT